MKLYQHARLDTTSKIREYLKDYTGWSNASLQYVKLPESLIFLLNNELNSKGLPNMRSAYSFRRFNSPFDANTCHVDASDTGLHKVSVIIPISGCAGTCQYWYDGKYHVEKRLSAENISYNHIIWDDEPKLMDSVEICDSPVISKADIPHSVYSANNEYRITYTFRFPENITFDEVCEKLK